MADGSGSLVKAKGAGVILRAPGGECLFLQRSAKSNYPGTWCWPGGSPEPGEDADETACRECEEEVGYTPDVGDLIEVDNRGGFTTFLADVSNTFEPTLNHEHDDFIWATPDEAPEPLHPGVAATIDDGLAQDDWSEADHPRAENGEFGSGGAGSLKATKAGSAGGVEARYDSEAKQWVAAGVSQERIKALAIPPAWTQVRIAANEGEPLQVVGYDSKNRAQYRYSAEHAKSQSAKKFARIANLVKKREALDSATRQEVQAGSDTAAAVRMMLLTGMRPGGDTDTGAEAQAYGATTLLKNHVTVDGDTISYDFTGKKGVRITGSVKDDALAGFVTKKLSEPGDRLFDTTSVKANQAVKARVGGDYKCKDLRTLKANELAAEAVAYTPSPKHAKERAVAIKHVATIVSRQLGNSPAVALKDYINEMVFSPWAMAA